MASPHEKAIAAATRTNDLIYRLFWKLGTRDHPQGGVLAAYRKARKAVPGALDSPAAIQALLDALRSEVEAVVGAVLLDAAEIGLKQAERSLKIYDLGANLPDLDPQRIEAGLTSTLAVVDQQITATQALAATTGLEEALLIGDGVRVGLLSPAPVVREGAKWTTTTAIAAWLESITFSTGQARAGGEFRRQAIAAIDNRTTDCCIRVHGQVVGLNEPFRLTGTPRYADEQQSPPFHDYCRTAEALVHVDDVEDDLTASLRETSRVVLSEREAQS